MNNIIIILILIIIINYTKVRSGNIQFQLMPNLSFTTFVIINLITKVYTDYWNWKYIYLTRVIFAYYKNQMILLITAYKQTE